MTPSPQVLAVQAFRIVRSAGIAGLAWLIYDWCLLIPREVKHFWLGKWTPYRLLYHFSRWNAAATLIVGTIAAFNPVSTQFCRYAAGYLGIANSIQIWALWAILMIRLHMLYQRRWIKFSMIILFVAGAVTMATLQIETIILTPWTTQPFPGVFFCSTARVSFQHRIKGKGIGYAWWIPTLVVEFYLFVLALFQLGWNIHYMRKRSLLFARPKQYVEVILRDSIWYFTSVLGVELASLFVFQHPTGHVVGGAQWTNALYIPFFAFINSRMSLDLLELMKRKQNGHMDTTYASGVFTTQFDMDDMRFARAVPPAVGDSGVEMTMLSPESTV